MGLTFRMNRRVAIFLCLVGFIWAISVMNMTLTSYSVTDRSSGELKDEIVRLSEHYVKQLAKETQNTVDGPFAARFTGYDLKKTMAVLLEEMLGRIEALESQVKELKANSSVDRLPSYQYGQIGPLNLMKQAALVGEPNPAGDERPKIEPIDMRGLILGAQEDCSLTPQEVLKFPACEGKIGWMRDHWTMDPCYSQYGVDGSYCSFRVYLSEVENWCPLINGRVRRVENKTVSEQVKAVMRFDLDGLLKKLENPGDRPNYDWIKQRIQRMWPSWVTAGEMLAAKQNTTPPRRKVLVHLGLLSRKSGFKMAENSMKGGPLGELVQWSDIICTLYMLGHELVITSEFEELAAILQRLPTAESQCQNREQLPMDIIFSDIVGLAQFKRKVRGGYGKFSCLLRIIDSFGTEPAFNYEPFAKANRLKTQWGMQNLNPQQFFTMFPHSPDNSFMGFVVENHLNETDQQSVVERKTQAVVYGKAEYMWAGKEDYLSVFHEFVDVHATVFLEDGQGALIPRYVDNHGIMSGVEIHQLLRESKLFIGLGFPYEGPAPLEAIGLGNVFINPLFDPPHNSQNTKFFSEKPTRRKLTSQHPYAEDFLGPPYVRTVDMDDAQQLRDVIKQALYDIDNGIVQPHLPYEYTQEGMLQRVSYYITKQDFCQSNSVPWLPSDEISYVTSKAGQSCKDACWANNRICEPSYFSHINSEEMLKQHLGVTCELTITHEHILYPAYRSDTGQCVLQKQPLLFSCVGEDPMFTRLCPCRTYMKEQSAICKSCWS